MVYRMSCPECLASEQQSKIKQQKQNKSPFFKSHTFLLRGLLYFSNIHFKEEKRGKKSLRVLKNFYSKSPKEVEWVTEIWAQNSMLWLPHKHPVLGMCYWPKSLLSENHRNRILSWNFYSSAQLLFLLPMGHVSDFFTHLSDHPTIYVCNKHHPSMHPPSNCSLSGCCRTVIQIW